MNRYVLHKAEDGIVWVSIQPLMQDVLEALDKAKNIKTDGLDNDEKRGVDFTVLTMEGVYQFLGSLLTEANLKELVEQENNKKELH